MKADDMGKACGFTGKTRGTHRLCGNAYRRENTRERKCRLEDNIRMDLKDIGWGGLECICQAEVRNK
jgi:hypothetical protein